MVNNSVLEDTSVCLFNVCILFKDTTNIVHYQIVWLKNNIAFTMAIPNPTVANAPSNNV